MEGLMWSLISFEEGLIITAVHITILCATVSDEKIME